MTTSIELGSNLCQHRCCVWKIQPNLVNSHLPVSVAVGALNQWEALLCCASGWGWEGSYCRRCTAAAHPKARNSLQHQQEEILENLMEELQLRWTWCASPFCLWLSSIQLESPYKAIRPPPSDGVWYSPRMGTPSTTAVSCFNTSRPVNSLVLKQLLAKVYLPEPHLTLEKKEAGTLVLQVLGNHNPIFWETGDAAAWGVVHLKKKKKETSLTKSQRVTRCF